MDFGLYPPEINSGRMYTGPGSGPLMAAAQAWGSLADELYTAASSYQSVVSGLTAHAWVGPTSTSMAAAADSYVEWLAVTAVQAEETADQARAAVAAYEAAFAATVPPEVVAANRSLLMMLVATNFLGQNTPTIAATEAQYAEMWAQDAVAMYSYAAASAAATVLTRFSSPHPNTDPGATAGQAAAVGQAASTSAGNTQSTLTSVSQALSAAPAATPAQADPLSTLANLITVFLSAPTDLATIFGLIPLDVLSGPVDFPIAFVGTLSGQSTDRIVSGWNGEEEWPGIGPAPVTEFPAPLTNLTPATVPASTVSAGLGGANTVGTLSVPSNWSLAASEVRPVALSSPLTSATATAGPAVEAGSAGTFNQMGLAGMAGQAMAGPPTAPGQDNGKAVTHARLAARGPGAAAVDRRDDASQTGPRAVVTGIAAAIRQISELRDQGRLTEQEYREQKNRLLGR